MLEAYFHITFASTFAADRGAGAEGRLRRAPLAGWREVDLPIPMPYTGDAGAAPSG
jgi:hypothetical protein